MGHKLVWTHARWSRAKHMRAAGLSNEEIVEAVGLTVRQVGAKFYNQHYVRARRVSAAGMVITLRVPDRALAERDGRNEASQTRTLTQIIFGDPPPGYSALDKKRQGI